MPEFRVLKPIEVAVEKSKIDPAATRAAIAAALTAKVREVGCYIFAAKSRQRRGKLIPVYVGQTKASFATECLTPATRAKVERYLKSHKDDALFLYLVAHPKMNGPSSGTAIDELEDFLIARAAEVNPKVENRRGVKPTAWSIHGVLGGGRGRRSEAAKQVAQLLDLAAPDDETAAPVAED